MDILKLAVPLAVTKNLGLIRITKGPKDEPIFADRRCMKIFRESRYRMLMLHMRDQSWNKLSESAAQFSCPDKPSKLS